MQGTRPTRVGCLSSTPRRSPVLPSPSAGLCPIPVVTGVASLSQPSQLPSGLLPASAPSPHFQLASVLLSLRSRVTWKTVQDLEGRQDPGFLSLPFS